MTGDDIFVCSSDCGPIVLLQGDSVIQVPRECIEDMSRMLLDAILPRQCKSQSISIP